MMLQNALNFIINLQGVSVTIRKIDTATDYVVKAAISNYFRLPVIEEEMQSQGRQYVISTKDLTFIPERGDRFTVSASQYFSIADVHEMTAFGNIIGYRMVLK